MKVHVVLATGWNSDAPIILGAYSTPEGAQERRRSTYGNTARIDGLPEGEVAVYNAKIVALELDADEVVLP